MMNMKKLFRSRLGFLAGLGLLAGVNAQAAQIDVFNSSITGNVVWTRDNTYILKEMVFVENGETLTIEAGTVIKGDVNATGSQKQIPSLVVARGGKLFAEGTPTQPIIFTASTDDVNNPSDLGINDRGLWGGVVVLGKAGINSSKNVTGQASSPKYDVFEGLIEEENFRFGGSDDDDSSGVIRYVSIRHGGKLIEVNKEINGLSLAGVGRGTTVEYVEVFANEDDGFEFFGGTVNTKYLVAAFCNDDSFDTDQGYRGKNQFWFVIQAPTGTRNYGGELAGDPVSPNNRTPLSDFTVYNATFIGAGVGSDNTTDNTVFDLKEDTAAKFYNSVFTDYVRDAVKIQNNATNRFNAGDIDLRNNIWGAFGNGTATPTTVLSDIVNGSVAQALFTESIRTNLLTDPMLKGISRTTNGGLDPRPNTGSPALSAANIKATPADGYYTPVSYMGAFGPSELWVDRWTALYEYGYTPAVGANVVNVFNTDVTGNTTWYRTNTYILKEMVFVENGETLTIEAGTVIKGDVNATGSQKQIPSLVVARGGKLFAEGTPTQPIIFTASTDDVNNPSDLGINDRGLWGGVVVLGKAGINSSKNVTGQASSPKYDVFEGLIEEENFRFGGSDDDDSSGVIRYVSIRHGGKLIEVNKEINGLSLAGVGRGTTVEYVEVFANEDDGFEFFGGTVNTKYLVAAFCNDDSFDTDQGYRGKNQFWFVIQAPTGTRNYGGELAGDPVSPNNRTPLSDFTVYNATFIGAGVGSDNTTDNTVFDLKEDTAAKFYNSVFTDYVRDAVKIQNNATNRFNAGDIDLRNNIWGAFGNGTATPTTVLSDIVNGSVAQALFTESIRTNLLTDPMLKGISRTTNGGLDPRPNTGSPALSAANIKATPGTDYYPASYIGAFNTVNWASDWTALNEYGFLTAKGGGNPMAPSGIPAKGPSSSQDPQVEALVAGVDFTAIITVGDTAANSPGWRYVGLGDGLGAFDNGNGTFTTLVNHEINETLGIVRAHGAKGTFVSKLVIDTATLQVLTGQDLITNVYTFNTNTFVYELGVNVLMGRFCSADLAPVSAFYNSGNGKGTQNRLFLNGEEFSTQSRAWAHIASGPETGNSWQLPLLGRASWENVVASPYMQDKTIVMGMDDDGTTDSQVYIYIGTKQATGTNDVEKAGLMNGQLFAVSVAGLTQEIAGTTEALRNFSLVNLSALTNVAIASFNDLETVGNNAGVTRFMRVEDGAWNPLNPNQFYFVTTASSSLPSRLWRLTFTDIANPEAGGVIEMMLNGTEGQIMFDNLGFAADGTIILQEDPGNNARLARFYKYYPATDGLIALGQAKQSLFKSGEPGFITQDEEVSGAIDVSSFLGAGAFLVVNQIHSAANVGNDPELVEGGQLLVMRVSGSAPSISSQPTPVNVGGGTAATFTVAATAGSTIQWYKNGVPIAGAAGTSYSIPSPTTGDAGEYVAVVTAANGSVSSTAVSLTVTDLAMYAGVAVAGPIGAQYDIQYTASLDGTPVWTTLERITLTTSPTLYIDQSSPGQAKRFYRALEVAP